MDGRSLGSRRGARSSSWLAPAFIFATSRSTRRAPINGRLVNDAARTRAPRAAARNIPPNPKNKTAPQDQTAPRKRKPSAIQHRIGMPPVFPRRWDTTVRLIRLRRSSTATGSYHFSSGAGSTASPRPPGPGHRILKSGTGPSVLQLSPRRIGIKESANAAWQASRAR